MPLTMASNTNTTTKSIWPRMIQLWIASCCVKILLQPAYHSTDALVHRHWKAVTAQSFVTPGVPVAEWYFDDDFIPNRHTLDYPPGFALFEAFWSNILPPSRLWPSLVGRLLVSKDNNDNNYMQWTSKCLQLLPSDDIKGDLIDAANITDVVLLDSYPACKAYLRSTVLLSDVIFWWGAWQVAVTTTATPWTTFLLITWNPAFLWLDHIHFQYNGFLLGVWMLSLACLLKGRRRSEEGKKDVFSYHLYHSLAAAFFALLLTLKHLYLPLSLWYLLYLLRYYCMPSGRLSWCRLAWMGAMTLTTLFLPFLPILWESNSIHSRSERLVRILQRLFPFGRGLVHDYWAGNWWAFYVATHKVLRKVIGRDILPSDVSPGVAAFILLFFVMPGAFLGAWRVAADCSHHQLDKKKKSERKSNSTSRIFWTSLTYTALAAFATAYHGHEKAILTALVPLTMGCCDSGALVWRTHAFALLSLLTLFFPAAEMATTAVSMTLYLAIMYHVLIAPSSSLSSPTSSSWSWSNLRQATGGHDIWTRTSLILVVVTAFLLETIPSSWYGRYSFVPLAITSLVSAFGLSMLSLGQVALVLWNN